MSTNTTDPLGADPSLETPIVYKPKPNQFFRKPLDLSTPVGTANATGSKVIDPLNPSFEELQGTISALKRVEEFYKLLEDDKEFSKLVEESERIIERERLRVDALYEKKKNIIRLIARNAAEQASAEHRLAIAAEARASSSSTTNGKPRTPKDWSAVARKKLGDKAVDRLISQGMTAKEICELF